MSAPPYTDNIDSEIDYQEALNTHRQEKQCALKATNSQIEAEEEKEKSTVNSYEEMIKALMAQLQEHVTANAGEKIFLEKKYNQKWGHIYKEGIFRLKDKDLVLIQLTNAPSTHQQNVRDWNQAKIGKEYKNRKA